MAGGPNQCRTLSCADIIVFLLSLKVDAPQRQIVVSPLKNRLSDNNATKVEFNGLPGDCKLSPLEGLKRQEQQQQLAEPDRYLHKKFKKVATLEETRAAPPRPDSQDERDTDGGPLEQTGHGGRYQCPHCGLVCAKPSVLQKHIRAHTNERPFPCLPCGIAFKTKSNLYKHGRSRGHALKAGKLEVTYDRVDETDGSSPSHQPSTTSSEDDDFDLAEGYRPPVILEPAPQQPSENNNRIYKPKFHKAAFYRLSEESPPTQPPSQELLQVGMTIV
ncbi:hypothetical protein AAG570_002658 [Ranatra chinensis]|uniref:C2H2-type domain-containing protein n=1 Tax=Ranatra chinensis TaxID=642074 RepID=A0ABD0YKF4_9HEMI